jgi:hypothetical protein
MNKDIEKLREKIASWDVEYINTILQQYTKFMNHLASLSDEDWDDNKEDMDYMEDCNLKKEIIEILGTETVFFTVVCHLIALECWRAMALKFKSTARDLINCRLPDDEWLKIRNIIMTD